MADSAAALTGPQGATALATAAAVVAEIGLDDPLALGTALRRRGIAPALAAAATAQVTLRHRAMAKFGRDAERMFFTRAGLEQATRAVVAARRADRLARSGVRSVADLGCGLGADALAFARAGLRVLAAELDPTTARFARANATALGLDDLITVTASDAAEVSLAEVDAVFCDPARRSGGRRIFDPARYSPPWDFVMNLPRQTPRTVLKLAPGIDHALLPPGCEAQWTSVRGEVVEATCWCGPLAEVPRRATVLWHPAAPAAGDPAGAAAEGAVEVAELTGSGLAAGPVANPRPFLYDPDGAVVRAHLVAEFAATVGGTLADPTIAYVYADQPSQTPFGRLYEIIQPLPVALKRLRSALRALGVGSLTILKRGSALDVERLRHSLRLTGEQAATLVLTRVADQPAAFLCRPVRDARTGARPGGQRSTGAKSDQ